jgi:4-hydroxy-2-oxoheptanedioate aldolase
MIETDEAVDNADLICATPGVDGVYIGPDDLTLSLGFSLGSSDSAAAMQRVLEAGRRSGVAVGRHCGSGLAAREALDAGFKFVAIDCDRNFLAAAAIRERTAAGFPDSRVTPRADWLCQVVLS